MKDITHKILSIITAVHYKIVVVYHYPSFLKSVGGLKTIVMYDLSVSELDEMFDEYLYAHSKSKFFKD